jgi:hypothetical protein
MENPRTVNRFLVAMVVAVVVGIALALLVK